MRIWPFRRREQTRSGQTWDTWQNLPALLFGPTGAGVTVTAENPISHDTVFSCINVIAEGCAMLPLYPYRKVRGGRELAEDHPLFDILTAQPTPHMTALQYWKLVLFEKLHYGNHYSLVLRGPDGRVAELRPVENGRVQPFWYVDPEGMERRAYRISMPYGGMRVLLEHEIFHVQNLPPLRGANYTLMGASVWQLYQAETIGGALATNEFANKSFANGGSLSGMLSVDGPLPPDEAKKLRAMIQDAYAGSNNAGKIGVFGGGMKWTPMSQDNERAQLLETRKYNRSVIAGILRVTAHLINDLDRATFSNVEHLDIAHYKHCLLPHLRDLRQALAKDVLTPDDRRSIILDHDETEMLRGDQRTFAEVLEKAVQNAQMTPNEARERRRMPRDPRPEADELYINSATVPLRLAAQGQGAPAAGNAAAEAPPAGPFPDRTR